MKIRIAVVADKSGSMQGHTLKDHIGGLQSFIEDQKKQPGETKFTLVQFDTVTPFDVQYRDVDIQTVKSEEVTILPCGGTPLLDAVGSTMSLLEELELKDKSDQVILMVITDGQENSSKDWTKAKLKAKIDEKKEDYQILFLGANIDSFGEASSYGLSANNAINFNNNNAASVNAVYRGLSRKSHEAREAVGKGLDKMAILNACAYDNSDYEEQQVFVDNTAGINGTAKSSS